LEIPSQRCVELVYEELIKICHTCGSTELSRYPRLQGKLIEVVSDLLRERLGPSSNYVESLISIQRAYINTNHPNFLGAAAAMSSVIQDKQEKEKKAVAAEEKRKREKRRLKELNGVNGVDTPEEDEEIEAPGARAGQLQARSQHQPARSMSPSMGRMAADRSQSIAGAMHGARAGSPPRFGGANNGARDSFLNYFFGKEGGLPQANPATSGIDRPGSRHVSNHIEPSFAGSIRRGDTTLPHRHIQEMVPDDYDVPMPGRDYDSPFVSYFNCIVSSQLY